MKIRKKLAIILSLLMIFATGMTSYAAEKQPDNKYSTNEIAQMYNITEDEVTNLINNVDRALQKESVTKGINENGVLTKTIPISENLILVLKTETNEEAALTKGVPGKRYTVTSTMELKNILGITVVTLNSTGVFESDFNTTKPVDAYGSYSASVWAINNTGSNLGGTEHNAWVRNTFSGQFNIGIDPVHLTIQSFSRTCTLHCDPNGNATADWT